MMKKMQTVLMLWLGAATLFTTSPVRAAEEPKRGTLEYFINGPQKGWTADQFKEYFKWRNSRLQKAAAQDDQILRRQKSIMNGNKITSEIWNYGSISNPSNNLTDIVWEGLGYGYEFAPFICAEIEVPANSHRDAYIKRDDAGNAMTYANGDTIWAARVISDGLISLGGEVSGDGKEFWGWEPLKYNDDGFVPYADPNSDRIPSSNDVDRDGDGKPDSWPEGWYNPNLKAYVWPGALAQGASNADMEAFFVVDDRQNKEFAYYPFAADSTRRGLGLQVECRYYQWANPLAEDIIFLIYKVTNKSDKDLQDVIFGMWGDPHIGGYSNYADDLAFFDTQLNMVYAWDENGLSDVAGKKPGYFGYKFLESPGNPYDGVDNDKDGMVDESMDDGIDNDGDWIASKHDVGRDGVENTGDEGENDGIPTAGIPFDIRTPGEPNFEWTDLDESDQIGLTSFAAPPYTSQNRISNDDYIYRNFLTPGSFDSANSTQAGDNIFLYGSGKITLKAGDTRRFSIALLVGEDYDDLTLNASTAQQIYEINYQFAKPPAKPTVTAVPGDERVTLYWDNVAEDSFDPVSKSKDFEGYVIYRSTDTGFSDQQTITDANGTKFLMEPLKLANGASARFDLDNEYIGLSDIPFAGRGVTYNLGSNTGLRHSFIDSNNVVNGQTYYYAVVSYDHGDDSLKIAPSECSKNITLDPERNEITLDVNTVRVVPTAPAAGYVRGSVGDDGILHSAGVATGEVSILVTDPGKLEDDNEFSVVFQADPTRYSVKDLKPISERFTARIDQYTKLSKSRIDSASVVVSSGGVTYTSGVDYDLLSETGQLRPLPAGAMQEGQQYDVSYSYHPLHESMYLRGEEANPIFDGLHLFVTDNVLGIDESLTRWAPGSKSNYALTVKPFNNLPKNMYGADYEVRFSNTIVDSSSQPKSGYIKSKFQVWEVTPGRIPAPVRIIILEVPATKDSLWSPGERVVILKGDEGVVSTWEFTLTAPEGISGIAPGAGDVYYIATTRPFAADDIYTFKTVASRVETQKASNELDRIAVVPNPYVATNALEPLDLQNTLDRGPRRIYFTHLPQNCTIRIYTTSGELVETLEHHAAIEDGKEYWDLTTKDNFPIAFGIYIYHVDAGSLGEKIGRFAVIK